ncbi:MAG: nucleotidyl transferase AbiEii/AbiGii toxin family protein, partial [Nitriliruptor sp.]
MPDHPLPDLPPRGREPHSKRHLDAWIDQAANRAGIVSSRLGWLVASSVVIAALQRARDPDGGARFLLKGGAWLELRLGLQARATADIDLLFRGDFDDLLATLDDVLATPWGALELQRGQVSAIDRAQRLIKPRRFDIRLQVRGRTWRRIQVEVSPDEGDAGARSETVAPPLLDHFGLPSPGELAGIVMDYQVAQKLHACTDPHDPPTQINDRVRDLAD